MSRIIGFGLNGVSQGEVHANCNRGWAINEGGQGTISVPAAVLAGAKWLDFGRMALVEHPKLPNWAGMIDTPWTATLPAKATLYNLPYLLHIRSLKKAVALKGSTGEIALQLLAEANGQENLHILPGIIDDDAAHSVKFDARDIWTQLQDLVKKAGMEMQLRAGRDENNHLAAWLDVRKQLGVDTGYLLHDGAGANLEITGAVVDGEMWNRVTGLSSKGGTSISSGWHNEEKSRMRYRLRSQVVQFPNVTSEDQLKSNVLTYMASNAWPYLQLTVNILDVGETFEHCGLGNAFMVQAAQLYLPGGITGWRGAGRLTAMAYDEESNKIAATLIGDLKNN